MRGRAAVALALALLAPAAAANGPIESTHRVVWREAVAGFGHFSGLEVSADGERFTVVGDKGSFAEGRLLREDGALAGAALDRFGALLDPEGEPVDVYSIDAEALTAGPDGRLYVAFEAEDRITVSVDIGAPPVPVPVPPAFGGLQNNSAIEALASAADGTLYAIPERSGRLDRPFPVYRFRDGVWDQPFGVPRRPPHLVTGAEVGPDGRLYVLERDVGLLGFRSRIRRFEIGPGGLHGEETVLDSGFGRFDNLEGLAIWQDDAGRIRLVAISDDNGRIFQRTEIVEFTLAPN